MPAISRWWVDVPVPIGNVVHVAPESVLRYASSPPVTAKIAPSPERTCGTREKLAACTWVQVQVPALNTPRTVRIRGPDASSVVGLMTRAPNTPYVSMPVPVAMTCSDQVLPPSVDQSTPYELVGSVLVRAAITMLPAASACTAPK